MGKGRLSSRRRGLAAALAMGGTLAACSDPGPGQAVMARVNKETIVKQQVDQALGDQPTPQPEQRDAMRRKALEVLIDQELAVQQAEALKLQRDPGVQQQLAAAHRDILARAYTRTLTEGVAKPTASEIQQHYTANPALYAQRRLFHLQELSIEARGEELSELQALLKITPDMQSLLQQLRSRPVRFTVTQATRPAEQLSGDKLLALTTLSNGKALVTRSPTSLVVLQLLGSQPAPLSLEAASGAIANTLLNQKKADLLRLAGQALRDKATIRYEGEFANAADTAAAESKPSASHP